MNKKSFNEIIESATEAADASIGSDLMKNCFERVKNICDNGFTTKKNFKKAFSLWKCLESITVHLGFYFLVKTMVCFIVDLVSFVWLTST